ncbi:DUF2213 domain-containing protein [Clostridium saccharoperbutylacetonicum]|uniref:DUF2213 domain-containing protein n=1 Tax=Clostridium saccharoperbutylacetonicum TaxID=36745 RepID=UPI0039EBF584
MKLTYYGDKISDNMSLTPEGYLTCLNVPIGRTGWMEYYGQELPADFNEPYGTLCKVYRSQEELFSEATISSFEGKSVTNTHPSENLDITTTPMLERGHMQNIRRDGDFLIADLIIKDAGLVSEIQNNIKREVSCGYDCIWQKIGDGKYEQKNIIGNHVAVVQNGRAGSRVAIHDSKPNQTTIGGKKYMRKITKKNLLARGLQAMFQAHDADPDEIAEAMDALNEEEENMKVEEPKKEKEVKDQEPDNQEQENDMFKKLFDAINSLQAEVASLKESKKEPDAAEEIMDSIEEDLGKEEVQDEEPETKEEEKKELEEGKAADSLRKFVQDMKPVIMAIPDEKTRIEKAKQLKSAVHDTKSYNNNGYADILNVAASNKKSAMDAASYQRTTTAEAAEKSCNAWKEAGEKMKHNK